MLDRNPKLAWCSEFEYAVDRIWEDGNWPQLDNYYAWLETNRIFQSSGFSIDPSLSYPQLVNSFLCQKRDHEKKTLVGATVHRRFNQLLRIWHNARFIHLVRDSRDVARSCIGMGWAGNVWTGVERWIEAEQLWKQLSQTIPAEQHMEMDYENLISEPSKALARLCEFMGVPYDQAMMDYTQTTTYSLPDPKYIGQWRHKFSDREIQLVEARIANMPVERGYELSGLPPLRVTPAREQTLRLKDRWGRVQFRLRRYGLALFLSDYLSRHLGFAQWQKRVRFKLNAIETRYLK
jgi:hypothetical protein